MGPPQLDIQSVIYDLSLTAPNLDEALLLKLAKSAALGLARAFAKPAGKGA